MGNILDCHPALDKKSLTQKKDASKPIKEKDSRNLYLIKEGGRLGDNDHLIRE